MPSDLGLTWAVEERPLPGETVNGDAYVVATREQRTLVTVIDGLGHGPEAAAAAGIAKTILEEHASEPLESLLTRCHRALRRTRGVVMTLVAVDHGGPSLEWLGVGNVEGALVRSREDGERPRIDTVFHFPGVVGYRLPSMRVRRVDLRLGDVLVLATDGIASSFLAGLAVIGDVEKVAQRILDDHGRASDDALVLVGRYEGTGGAG